MYFEGLAAERQGGEREGRREGKVQFGGEEDEEEGLVKGLTTPVSRTNT